MCIFAELASKQLHDTRIQQMHTENDSLKLKLRKTTDEHDQMSVKVSRFEKIISEQRITIEKLENELKWSTSEVETLKQTNCQNVETRSRLNEDKQEREADCKFLASENVRLIHENSLLTKKLTESDKECEKLEQRINSLEESLRNGQRLVEDHKLENQKLTIQINQAKNELKITLIELKECKASEEFLRAELEASNNVIFILLWTQFLSINFYIFINF